MWMWSKLKKAPFFFNKTDMLYTDKWLYLILSGNILTSTMILHSPCEDKAVAVIPKDLIVT